MLEDMLRSCVIDYEGSWDSDECKTHLCFEFISQAILSILYPYSCKTINISSKFGFEGFFMEASDLVRKDAKCFQKES